jgi:serine protease Do
MTINLSALLGDANGIVEQVRQSTVSIQSGRGGGTGTVWGDGFVVTNSHVLPDDADHAQLEAWDGARFEAEVLVRDAERDLAVLRVPSEVAASLSAIESRETASLRPGELVIAVGHPWGEPGATATGVVAAVGPAPAGVPQHLEQAVYADIQLAPGNSGGPLVDARGRLVGINAMINGGLGVAVPSEYVATLIAEVASPLAKGVLGIAGDPVVVQTAEGDADALLLTTVEAAGAAEAAGLIPGDLLLGVDGQRGVRAMTRRFRTLQAGASVQFEVMRAGALRTLEAVPAAA